MSKSCSNLLSFVPSCQNHVQHNVWKQMRIATNCTNIYRVKAMESCRLFHGIWKYYTPIWHFMPKPVWQQKRSIVAGYHILLAALLFTNSENKNCIFTSGHQWWYQFRFHREISVFDWKTYKKLWYEKCKQTWHRSWSKICPISPLVGHIYWNVFLRINQSWSCINVDDHITYPSYFIPVFVQNR